MVTLAKREEESKATNLIQGMSNSTSLPVALWETYPFGAPYTNLDAEASWVHTSIFLCLACAEKKKLNREAIAKRDRHIIVKVVAASDYGRVLSSLVDARRLYCDYCCRDGPSKTINGPNAAVKKAVTIESWLGFRFR